MFTVSLSCGALGRLNWNDSVSNFCALEWLVAERPTEGFLDAPMGDCGLRLRGDSYQGHVSRLHPSAPNLG